MDLADSIYEANQGSETNPQDLGYDDELGLRVWDKIDYVVARALTIAVRDRSDPYTINQPHMRGDAIYVGQELLEESVKNIYRLSEFNGKLKPGQDVIFWKKLKEHLPRLQPNIIQISDNLFWDKNNGEPLTWAEMRERCMRDEN